MIAVIAAAVLSPIILLVMLVIIVFSGGAEYNKEIASYYFSAEKPLDPLSAEQQKIIKETRESLQIIDDIIAEKENDLSVNSFDSNRVKAVFLVLQTQIEWDNTGYETFINCFIRDCETTIDGKKVIEKQYDEDLKSVFKSLNTAFPETQITSEHIQFIDEIYNYLLKGFI